MSGDNKLVHFTAGAVSGTLGSIVTCPLDVAKTRLQSSIVETYRRVDNHPKPTFYKTLNNINNSFFNNNNAKHNNSSGNNSNNKSNNRNNKSNNSTTNNSTTNNNTTNNSTNNNSKTTNSKNSRKIPNLERTFFSNEGQQKLRFMSTSTVPKVTHNQSVGFVNCIRHIVHTEGYRALFKGLMPTLVGVAPARAIYFTTYEYCKKTYSNLLTTPSTSTFYQNSLVHLLSAASAGITCTTVTNPIWMIRTRLQLNNKSGVPLTTFQCVKNIQQQHGFKGFYKGLTASYFGVTETAIHFVIYEAIKARIIENRSKSDSPLASQSSMSLVSPDSSPSTPSLSTSSSSPPSSSLPSSSPPSSLSSSSLPPSSSSSAFKSAPPLSSCVLDGDEEDFFDVDQKVLSPEVPPMEFVKYMVAACISKTIATIIAYPHEVARTRMREGNAKYTNFVGTLLTVAREEGTRALYRGLVTQLIKHIPNTAIVLTTYETVVYVCNRKGF